MNSSSRFHLFPMIGAGLLLLVGLAPTTVEAGNEGVLAIKPMDSGKLTYGQWEYREISTRSRFWAGCWGYDFLQGSGCFPSTWYTYIEPTTRENSDDLFYSVDRTARACYCHAKPDQINSLSITHTTDDGSLLEGYLRIVPDFSVDATAVTVRCAPAGVIDSPCLSCGLTCEEARIPWDGRSNAEITVIWEEL